MELIKPSEISARILTLLDESDERVIIVSPYMKISKWFKLQKKLNELKSKKIIPELYVREDPENHATYRDLDQLELNYHRIPHLHAKLYMNEKSGIVTSMNLLLSSEINSLEIGYATETESDLENLLAYFYMYIFRGDPAHSAVPYRRTTSAMKVFMDQLRGNLEKSSFEAWLWHSGQRLEISSGIHNYLVSITEGSLKISTTLKIDTQIKISSVQSALLVERFRNLTKMKINLHRKSGTNIFHLTGQPRRKMKSTGISGLHETEVAFVIKSVVRFITATQASQHIQRSLEEDETVPAEGSDKP